MITQPGIPLSSRHKFSDKPTLNLTAAQLEVRDLVADHIDNGFYRLEPQQCCICGTPDGELISERERYGLANSTVLCNACGLLRTNPVLRQQDYANFYSNSYRTLYFEEKFASERFFDHQKRIGTKIVEYVERVTQLPQGSLVLDVGCGAGGMVKAFVDNGYRGIGTDYDENYLKRGRKHGLDLRKGNLFNLTSTEKPRLILYSHVLEHVHDPNIELQEARNHLHDEGYLYVELPGIKHDLRSIYQADLIRFFHIAHLYHFTLTTLTNLLHRNGFELVSGNENIQSVWRKANPQPEFASDYRQIKTYLVNTDKFRIPLALKAIPTLYIKMGYGTWLKVISSLLRKIGLYSIARTGYKKLLNR